MKGKANDPGGAEKPDRPLRIAVDFPWDASAHMGTGAYSETMVRALAQAALESEIILLISRESPRNIDLPNVRYLPLPPAQVAQEGPRQIALPAVLEAIHADCLFAPASLLPAVKVCPMISTVHDLAFQSHREYYSPGLLRYLDQWFEPTLKAADLFVAISDEAKEELISLRKIDPGRITVVHQPVRETFHEPLVEAQAQDVLSALHVEEPFFFHVSNLSPHKNVTFVLELLAELVAQDPGCPYSFVFAGGGFAPNQPPDYLKIAHKLGIERRVRYVGRVSDDELKALYQGAKALLFPSLIEGWGLPVAEARALGTPVVASPHVPAAPGTSRVPLEKALWMEALNRPMSPGKPDPGISFQEAGEKLMDQVERLVARVRPRPRIESSPLSSEKPRIALRADWRSPSGLGQAARYVFGALKAAGLRPIPVWVPKDRIQDRRLFTGELELYRGEADLWIHLTPPDHYDLKLAGKHVGLFFWETDRLPEGDLREISYRDRLNDLSEVWVGASFLEGVLRESGVTVPVFSSPVPVDADFYSPGPRRPPCLDLPSGFDTTWTVFLYVGTWDPRKRPDILVRAFTRAFRDSDHALLIVKSYVTGDAGRDREILGSWVAGSRAGSGHVRVIPEILTDEEMLQLYRSATVFATASRGEGYCLPAVQAMSSGKPVLSVSWSSLADLVAIPVSHRLESVPREVTLPGYSSDQRWAAIEECALQDKLVWAHGHRVEVLRLGREARGWVLEHASFQAAGQALRRRIEGLLAPRNLRLLTEVLP
jgi:glycosyltransferase involved in cell wall biosynthesis